MDTDQKKAVVRRYLEEAWSGGSSALLPELLAPNYELRVLQRNPGRPDVLVHGPEALAQSLARYRVAFPDLQIKTDLLVAEGDRVVAQWTAHATHRGTFFGIAPTGKQVSYDGISIFRLADNKIAEEQYLGDRLGLWQQLGVVPESATLVAEARSQA